MNDDDDDVQLRPEHLAVGQTVKARTDGEFKRADVVDKIESRPEEYDIEKKPIVKVHWWGTKPAADKWLLIKDVRIIKQFTVDWDDIKVKLPIAHDPESRARRKTVFTDWSTEGKGALSLKELQAGVQKTFGDEVGEDIEELHKAVEYAHKVARTLSPSKKKGGAKRVDHKEFHGFITALRYYLELAELFEHLDAKQEDDQKLSLREVRKGLTRLEDWGITSAMLDKEFSGVDVWTPKWKFADFAKFCVEKRWSKMEVGLDLDSSDDEVIAEEGKEVILGHAKTSREKMRNADAAQMAADRQEVIKVFKSFDQDGSNKISEKELAEVLAKLNPEIDDDAAKAIFLEADVNSDGQIDVEEFCLWIFSQDEL
jgi:hypothetical protein